MHKEVLIGSNLKGINANQELVLCLACSGEFSPEQVISEISAPSSVQEHFYEKPRNVFRQMDDTRSFTQMCTWTRDALHNNLIKFYRHKCVVPLSMKSISMDA